MLERLLPSCYFLFVWLLDVSAPPVQTLTYAVSGKVSINAPADRQVLRFRWQQADGFYDVWLWGALGVGRTHLQGTQEALKITAPQQPIITGPAAQIMQDRLGWASAVRCHGCLAGRRPSVIVVDVFEHF